MPKNWCSDWDKNAFCLFFIVVVSNWTHRSKNPHCLRLITNQNVLQCVLVNCRFVGKMLVNQYLVHTQAQKCRQQHAHTLARLDSTGCATNLFKNGSQLQLVLFRVDRWNLNERVKSNGNPICTLRCTERNRSRRSQTTWWWPLSIEHHSDNRYLRHGDGPPPVPRSTVWMRSTESNVEILFCSC